MPEPQTESSPRSAASRAGLIVVTLLLFFLLLYVLASMNRSAANAWSFVADEAYLDLAVSKSLAGNGFLGLGEQTRIPATADTLWHLIVMPFQKMAVKPVAVPVLLSTLFAVWMLLKLKSAAVEIRGGDIVFPSMLLLAAASGLAPDVLSGRSTVLCALLVLLMLEIYLKGMPRGQWPLPPMAAWWAGLLALVRIEMIVVWLALAIHALVVGPFREGRGRGLIFPFIRFLTGVLLILLVLLPALGWNFSILRNPWPRFPDAPLSLDSWAMQPAGEVLGLSVSLTFSALLESYLRAFSVPLLRGFLPLLFLFAGIYYSVNAAFREPKRLQGTVGLALLLVPFLYALIYPYVGWGASYHLFASLQPAWAILMAVGVVEIASSLNQWITRTNNRDLAWLTSARASALFLALLLSFGLILNLVAGNGEAHQLRKALHERKQVLEALGPASAQRMIASDRVGWLAYTLGGRYLDLTGRATPILLAYRDQTGWHGEEASAYIQNEGVTHLVIFDEAYAYVEPAFRLSAADPLPRVHALRR